MDARSKIIKISLYYIIFFIVLSIFFSVLYYNIDNRYHSFYKYMIFSFYTSIGHSYHGLTMLGNIFNIIQITHIFIMGISFPIFTSFIFFYCINMPPKIIFPSKLIIRRDSNDNIILSVLIGNKEYEKNRKFLYDVKCKIKYSFAVDKNKRYIRNAKTQLEEKSDVIIGFYRFSFLLTDFPDYFIESILSQDKIALMDTLMINIYGNFSAFRGNFIVTKVYKLSEICIASGNQEIYREEINNGKIEEIFTWHNMNKLLYYKKHDELQIKNDLQKKINIKSYSHIILPSDF